MAERNDGAIKRQRVAVVEPALANIDVVSHLGSFLTAKDLCQVKATCKALARLRQRRRRIRWAVNGRGGREAGIRGRIGRGEGDAAAQHRRELD